MSNDKPDREAQEPQRPDAAAEDRRAEPAADSKTPATPGRGSEPVGTDEGRKPTEEAAGAPSSGEGAAAAAAWGEGRSAAASSGERGAAAPPSGEGRPAAAPGESSSAAGASGGGTPDGASGGGKDAGGEVGGPVHPEEPTPMPRPKSPRTPNLALRRLKAGFKPSRGQAIVAVVLALVACMAVVQVRVNRADDGYQNARREDLIAILDGLGQNTRRLESEIAELEERKNTLESSADKAQTAREQAEAQVRVLGILAGTLPAQGPGVRITLNDPDGKMTSSNLLDAIEELRDAGAEAIQINGSVRVVASTDLVDDSPGIRIDGQKVSSPYVIEAIGESHNLAEAANFPGGLVSEVTGPQVGGTAEVTELPLVQITALHAPEEHRYARPAPSPTK
ncbi:DUF881 domain-containing protein [Kribbella swartbergensis]